MSDQGARFGEGSVAVSAGADGAAGTSMAHGAGGLSLPPGVFIDPCHWGVREPGSPLVPRSAEEEVIEPCLRGFGGARAWAKTHGSETPSFWMFSAYDHTVRWRAKPLTAEELAVEAFWVSAIPNSRLGDQLRRSIFAENRRRSYPWRDEDAEAWREAERVERGARPAPFVWRGSACLGGRSEGDGGLPLGMTARAFRVRWRVVAATRQYAFLHVIWELTASGEEGDAIRRGARIREQMEHDRMTEVVWVRQWGDRQYYGNQFCPHCVAGGRCARCLFVDSHFVPHEVFFQEPTMLSSSKDDWRADVALYRDMGVLE